MHQGYRVGAILLMAGLGSRLGGGIPKQFQLLGGKPLYRHALETILQTGVFDEVIVVCSAIHMVGKERGVRIVEGGATRQQSAKKGLEGFGERPDIVLIHDAARPFVTSEIIFANLDAAIVHGAVDTCIATTDTLVFAPEGEKIHAIPKREEFLRGQTPQTFRYSLIVEAHERALEKGIENASDDCGLVFAMGQGVAIVKGSEMNFKITSSFDFKLAEALISLMHFHR